MMANSDHLPQLVILQRYKGCFTLIRAHQCEILMDGRRTSYSFKTLVVSTRADKGGRIQVNPLAAEFKSRALSRVAKLKWQRTCKFSAPRVRTCWSLLLPGVAVKNWSQPEAMVQEGRRLFMCPFEDLLGRRCPPFLLLPHSAKPRLAAQSYGTLKTLQPFYLRLFEVFIVLAAFTALLSVRM